MKKTRFPKYNNRTHSMKRSCQFEKLEDKNSFA